MSYDLRLGVKVDGTDIIAVIAEPECHGPTYNLGRMFRACMDWDFEQGTWYQVSEVLPKIEHGIHELRFNRSAYEQFNPENGWGDIGSALRALESIVECVTRQNDGWTWNQLPPELLWLSW